MAGHKPTIEIIGAPTDLGANMRGAVMGPAAIRIAGLSEKIQHLGYKIHDTGDINVPVRETLPDSIAKAKFLNPITNLCMDIHHRVENALRNSHLPIVIGGDHSIAIGSIAAVSNHWHNLGEDFGIIWVDAHADINTPQSSPSGNIHGMPLAISLGKGESNLVKLGGKSPKVKPENVALIGIRTLDSEEKDICRQSGIRYYTMREIDERGMATIMKEALSSILSRVSHLHLSFDLDGVDPLHAPGVSTPSTGGISLREAHLALEMIADTGKLGSMDFVELNPLNDVNHMTAKLTVELIQSALGKSIV